MRVVLGGDQDGFELKQDLLAYVRDLGHEVLDAGTTSPAPVDYPDFAEAVGLAIRGRQADRGILICGSGVGASVAANKIPGIRAGLCHDTYSAHQGVEHDDMNILVMGSRVIAAQLAYEVVKSYLSAKFTGEERHLRRIAKIDALERRFLAPEPALGDFPGPPPGSPPASVTVTGGATGFTQEILAGTHRLYADEPVGQGGTGAGPSPYEF